VADHNTTVRAGGGVVWRRRDDGGLEIVLVHRPQYDDWSLPKGKVDPGETDEEAALREVEEETGLKTTLGRELPSTRYKDRFGRDKVVRYWVMPVQSGEVGARHEVDDARWVPVEEAKKMLSYGRDAAVVDGFVNGSA
jgi:8-oxo-dGTP pyrophosphatase MutT (NUDIX family)